MDNFRTLGLWVITKPGFSVDINGLLKLVGRYSYTTKLYAHVLDKNRVL